MVDGIIGLDVIEMGMCPSVRTVEHVQHAPKCNVARFLGEFMSP